MKFSIRALFAFTFLFALALLVWRTIADLRRDEARVQRLQAEIKSLESRVRLNQPALHEAILHTRDEYEPLQAMRASALAHFNLLHEKYSGIDPQGAGVLSIRWLPSMPGGDGPAPVALRMLMPDDRPVWLKFGVHKVSRNASRSRGSDAEDDLIGESPFASSGPFEPAKAIDVDYHWSIDQTSLKVRVKASRTELVVRARAGRPLSRGRGSGHAKATVESSVLCQPRVR